MPPPGQFVKWLSKQAGSAAWLPYEDLFDNVTQPDLFGLTWQRIEFHFSRAVPTGYTEDRAITKLDCFTMSDFGVFGSLDAGDITASNTAFSTMWGSILPRIQNTHTLVEYRWYNMSFRNPLEANKRFTDRGAPHTIYADTRAGSDSASAKASYQTALSVTFKTGARRHWGRMYIPGLGSTAIGATGRVTNAAVDAVATAIDVAFDALFAANVYPVVVSTQVDGALVPGILGISTIQVDNIPDVIRRRRPKQRDYAKVIAA